MVVTHIVATAYCFFVSSVIVVLTVVVFAKITRYNDWEEVKKGNVAAAMVLAGNIFAIGNVMRFAITSNNNLVETFVWGVVGLILLLAVHFLFEKLAPRLNVDEEIHSGNKAVALIMMALSVAFSYVIGASIT